ncbi:MAG: helix-turn-helix domain-containing protein [Clostridia bacterium]|nr:helix-turn-helix domain-containing protein [Clostridia bacterium]
MVAVKRAYLSIEEIAKEYLPMSRKKIRELVTKNLSYRKIGGRIYVSRQAIEEWLKENK